MNIEELNTQLEYLGETKGLIKQAIINKGQDIGENDTFRSFVQKINNIETGIETNRVPIWFMYLNTAITDTLEELLEDKTSLSFDIYRSNAHIYLFRVDDFDDVIRETPQIGDFVYVSSIKLLKEIDGTMQQNIPYFAFGQIDSTAHTEYYISGTFKVIDAAYNENFTNALKITSGKIKSGETILEVTGTYTSDANATASDIVGGKTAYVNGQKITGSIASNSANPITAGSRPTITDDGSNINVDRGYGKKLVLNTDQQIRSSISYSDMANLINLTADKIKSGVTILGITGTAQTIKTYATQQDMEQALNDGEIESGDFVLCEDIYNFYIAETNAETGDTDLIRLIRENMKQ